jgi:circadian clock protein KaiC
LFGGKGFYEGSSILVTGEAGSGKSSLSAHFVSSICDKNQKAIMFLFEESEDQVKRNMLSIGVDLQPYIDKGLLKINATRPTQKGLEAHLLSMIDEVDTFNPKAVVIDPISSFWSNDVDFGIKALITQIIDHFKSKHITGMFMHLMHGIENIREQDTLISSLIDTWLILRNRESNFRRHRELFVVKSRGMAHNHSVNTFKLTDDGFIVEGEVEDEKHGQ